MQLPQFIPIRRDPLVISRSLHVDLSGMEPHEALNAIEVAKHDAGCLAREILGDLNRAEMEIRNGGGRRPQTFAPDGAGSLCRACTGSGVQMVNNEGTMTWGPCDGCAGTGLDTPVVVPAD